MSSKTIIMLEDDTMLRDHYCLVLESHGYTIIGADNSNQILELINKHSPALVITDLLMPESGGTEGILKIFDNSNIRNHIPVIVISAFENLIRVVEPLVAVCLQKPVTDEELINTVKEVLHKK